MDRPLRCNVRLVHVSLIVLLCLGLVGCGSSASAPTAAVSGKVTDAGGAGLKGGTVSFSAAGKGYGPVGSIKEDGTYQLSTFEENDGAPPGDYTVTVTDAEGKERKVTGGGSASVKSGSNTLDFKVE